MAVLQFAWGGDSRSPHLPHNHYENSFCYPGTHDNQTTQGWFESLDDATKVRLASYAAISDAEGASWGMIRLGMSSVSRTCVFTMQDVLCLGDEARMNTPGVADGNWTWRVGSPGFFSTCKPQAKKLRKLATLFERVHQDDSSNDASLPDTSLDVDTEQGTVYNPKKRFLGMF